MEETPNKNKDIKNDDLILPDKIEKQKIENNEMNNSRYTLTSKSLEDSVIKGEEIDDDMNINSNSSYKEKQLAILLNAFEMSYSKKSYKDLIKDIEEKEILLYANSLISFKIKIIKIESLLKLIKEEYNNYLKVKNKSFHELDEIIHKIKSEFQIISMIIINNNSYEYEITTQIYCKFLYLLSKLSLKREDYLKSLGYVTLGVNMLKIYFIRNKVGYEIGTYKIYCKLVLEIINILIGDKNYEQALYYIRLLLKIIEIATKWLYNNSKKAPIATIKKFISFGAIGYIYTGCCLEQLDDPIQAFEAYKQAKLFSKKGSKLGISFQNLNSITINNSCSYLVEEVFEKLKLKFERDKIDRLNRQKRLELQRKKEEIELLQNEKLMKLKFIANGIGGNPFKLEKLENKLNKKIFPTSVVNNLEKIDDDLNAFVYTYFNKNKSNYLSSYNSKISIKTKKLMSRYEVYNILMSKKFREFIMKTKKLEFYNLKTGSRSISTIQRYLNKKIQIDSNSNTISTTPKKSKKVLNNNFQEQPTQRINTYENLTTSPESKNDKIIDKILFLNKRKIKYRNNNLKFLLTQDNTEKSSINKLSLNLNNTTSRSNIKFKYKLNKDYNLLENSFERKYLDKNLMTKNYLRKYSYYNKLSNKELKFQKDLLYFKYHNTLYNPKKSIEEKNGIIGKDDLHNISLIMNENARIKPLIDENMIDIDSLKDTFGSKQNKLSVKMKSAMSSVISKYINERKSKAGKENLINVDKIKKYNEKKISILDNSIKNINYNISQMKYLMTKTK